MSSSTSRSPHLRLITTPEKVDVSQPDAPIEFEAIFEGYIAYVAAIGLRLLGRPDEVDDLVQDVFFTAYRKLHHLKNPAAVKPWLATTTVRLAKRKLHIRRLRQFVGLDRWEGHDTLPSRDAAPEVKVMVASLFKALDQLSPEVRIVWTLKHVEGEKLQTIATLCGCSERTVKRRLKTAQLFLKETWDED